ncbi:ComEC/Rec2 family competence protein [Rhizobium sp. Leaf262]|uniref:ComEC/Rec2 family competence protein n=1 Tax=Rhizobium sp. Leaf262 TaxID=1736312 RepID=UPI001FCD2E33|nr:ComEC/Rec2 family competence protein [Rhizobium sp. Leaf262]
MNTQDEKQHFRGAEASFAAQAELDELLLPLHVSRGVIAVERLEMRTASTWYSRSRLWVVGRIQEEIAYRQDFLFVPVFIAAGVALWFGLPVTPSRWFLLALVLGVASLAVGFRHRPGLTTAILKAAALLGLGMLLADWEARRAGTIILDTPVTTTIVGTVERRELDALGNWRYLVALSSTSEPKIARAPQTVSLVSRSSHDAIPIGGAITGKARLSPPSGPALPGLNDFAFAAYFNGIGATGYFYGPPKAMPSKVEEGNAGFWLEQADSWLYTLRSGIAQRIRHIIGGDAGAFAASIVTDERRAISGETMEALRVSGLAHIVAISGLNMALAAGIFFIGMRSAFSLFPGFSQRRPVKKISAFAALLMTLCYYLISGFAVSAERAWLMMSIMLIAVLVDKPSISLRNVALSALVIIVLSPHEVMGPSFQMSFAATLALVSSYSFWSRWRGERERFVMARPPLWLSLASKAGTLVAGVIVTSLIGGISTAIYSIEHFHRITTYGLAANLAAMPVMSLVVMPFALIGMLLMPFGLDAPFLKIMGYGMAVVIDIAKTVSSWGGDETIGRQNGWFLAISTSGFLLIALLRTRLALIGLPFIAAGFAMLVIEQGRSRPDLLIYEDGSLVALLTKDAVATTKQRASGFVYEQWARAVPLPDLHIPANMLATTRSSDEKEADGKRPRLSDQDKIRAAEEMQAAFTKADVFTCRKDSWCAARSQEGATIAVIFDSTLTAMACDVAKIVVTTRRAPFSECHSGAILFSQDVLRRTGSLELWLGDDARPVIHANAAMEGSHRAWTMHRAYEWRSDRYETTLPLPIERILSPNR